MSAAARPSRLDEPPERAILVGVHRAGEPEWSVRDTLEELGQLATGAGVTVLDTLLCRLRRPSAAHLVGRGQAEDLAGLVRERGADVAIFDDDLTPAQGRNIEEVIGVRTVDRTQVILDIFARRARTREGRLQVELAQLQYLLPRLRRMWTHLERQKGGIGLKGPGEQQLELDRRRVEGRITRLRGQLEHVRARRAELRRGRSRHGWALVCLVGYTNAGKSTLLNALTDARVPAGDRLFATLDPTTRRIDLPNHQAALLTDTVGFIRKLPHRLVEAFQATLEEATQADLLLHVVDASHPRVDAQVEAVEAVLRELHAEDKPRVHVLNKIDRPQSGPSVRALQRRLPNAVPVSAREGAGLAALRSALADGLRHRSVRVELVVPASDGRTLALLREAANIQSERCVDDRIHLVAAVPGRLLGALAPYLAGGRAGDAAGEEGACQGAKTP